MQGIKTPIEIPSVDLDILNVWTTYQ